MSDFDEYKDPNDIPPKTKKRKQKNYLLTNFRRRNGKYRTTTKDIESSICVMTQSHNML